MSVQLPLLTFNDVYRVRQRYVPQTGCPDPPGKYAPDAEISVGQFAQLIYDLRDRWAQTYGTGVDEREGLVLFAGDVFSPSVESSVTRGSHLVPVMNALRVDCAVVGNHDFDFGYPHMTKLVGATHFPWLLSNVVDADTGTTPVPLKRFWVTERSGVRIGIIGLVEEDWIATIPSWPTNFRYRQMKEVALELSRELRDPAGPHRVDIIIALTHSRVPNDIKLANEVGAVAGRKGVEDAQGVDLIIGGHDHIYYIGKGADAWDGYAGMPDLPGSEDDHGVRLIKSGTDFRDLSEVVLELSPPNDKAVRRRIIARMTGKHHYVVPSSNTSVEVERMMSKMLASVTKTLSSPVCYTLTPFDARSEVVRTRETGLGNWAADVLLHAYDESLAEGDRKVQFEKEDAPRERQETGADAVIICGGTLRGDSQYGPGPVTLGNILEIFPFDDAVVCLEIDGKGIWDTLESALSKWPAQEGRFPVVAGLAVEWDHRKPPGHRINSIHLVLPDHKHDGQSTPDDLVKFVEQPDGTRIEVTQCPLKLGDEVKNEAGGRMYTIITREYMAEGFDGFEALKGRKFIIDHENGQTMSNIVRSFLLGSAWIFRNKQLEEAANNYLSHKTIDVLARARARHHASPMSSLASSPRNSMDVEGWIQSPSASPEASMVMSPETSMLSTTSFSALSTASWSVLRRHVVEHNWVSIREAMHIARHEHMSTVDTCEGDKLRSARVLKKGEPETPSAAPTPSGSGAETPRPPPGMLVDEARKAELKELGGDVAIVCPLVDGRLRDVAAAPEQ